VAISFVRPRSADDETQLLKGSGAKRWNGALLADSSSQL